MLRPSPPRRTGFTLVEILVVTGLIALLISILLPALNSARQSARQTMCLSQLRQIGQGIAIYAVDGRQQTPAWSGYQVAGQWGTPADGAGVDEVGPGWTEMLAASFTGPASDVYRCPSHPAEEAISYWIPARHSYLSGRRSTKLSRIRLSSSFVMAGDCTQPVFFPGDQLAPDPINPDDCDKDDASWKGTLFADEPGGTNLHKAGNNLLFADSHAATFEAEDPNLITYHPTQQQAWADVTP